MADSKLMADIKAKRLSDLVAEADDGRRRHGDSDVTLVDALDSALLRTTPGVKIGSDGPEVGGKTYCTDFFYEGYHFRHVFMMPRPDEDDGMPENWEELFTG